MSNKNPIDKKVNAYIENLFSGVGASQALFDLKEELVTNLHEKIADYKASGMEDDQAFKEAVISMGDLSGLVEDMRKLGQDTAKQSVYTTMTSRISTAGIVAGVLLMLFGVFTATMLYFMRMPAGSVTSSGIFIVAGGALLTYSILTRENRDRYGMNKIRDALYALAIGLILFSIFVATTTVSATGEIYTGIASLMVFFLAGIGLLLFLLLTGTTRRKNPL